MGYGSLLVWEWPFPGYGGGGGLVVCVQSRGLGARAPRLSGFILPGGFSDILPFYLWFRFWAWSMIAIFSCFCTPEGVINGSCGKYGSFLAWG